MEYSQQSVLRSQQANRFISSRLVSIEVRSGGDMRASRRASLVMRSILGSMQNSGEFCRSNPKNAAFTIIELLLAVAIMGILSAVAIPLYTGYVNTAEAGVAQSHLRSVYLQQQEYFSENGQYYANASCGDNADLINLNLFAGTEAIDDTAYRYCVTQSTPDDFVAQAVPRDAGLTLTINQLNQVNF